VIDDGQGPIDSEYVDSSREPSDDVQVPHVGCADGKCDEDTREVGNSDDDV
jgi:hypothetical protein